MMNTMPSCHENLKISVVIATINRAEALQDFSLPSLARQDYENFEVIIWDASDRDDSQQICKSYSSYFHTKGISLQYHTTPRRGSASQRNDAVTVATGDIVFFMDDDCEISSDSLSALNAIFTSFPWLKAAGVPMINKTPASGNSSFAHLGARLFGMRNNIMKRKILKSGALSLPLKDLPGFAEWLSGGSAACKKDIFDDIQFDERLEQFGGHALGEDYDFSHRIMLHYGEPLLITTGGLVIHHAASGGNRTIGKDRVAATFFNMRVIRKNFSKYKKMPFLPYIWQILGTILFLLFTGVNVFTLLGGIKQAIDASLRTSD